MAKGKNENIKLLREDYVGAILEEIGTSDDDSYHFIFKKGEEYFGIKVKREDFTTMNYVNNNMNEVNKCMN